MYIENKKKKGGNKNNLPVTIVKNQKQFRHVVDRMCALLCTATDCGSRNDTSATCKSRTALIIEVLYHRTHISVWQAESDVTVMSAGQVGPPTQEYWWQTSHSFNEIHRLHWTVSNLLAPLWSMLEPV